MLMLQCSCQHCGAPFDRQASTVRRKQGAEGRHGPFCSKRCAMRFVNRLRGHSGQSVHHGTPGAYTNRGCRCDACRRAWREYIATRRHPAEPASGQALG